jgi:hypothetical protein
VSWRIGLNMAKRFRRSMVFFPRLHDPLAIGESKTSYGCTFTHRLGDQARVRCFSSRPGSRGLAEFCFCFS